MTSTLMPNTKFPPTKQKINARKFSPPHFFITHFTKSRIFIISSGPHRSRTKAAINDRYTIVESFYELLGVGKNGSTSEIKRAYKQLVRKYHPDASPPGRAEEYTRTFIRVQEAYETLSDPQARALYDRNMYLPLQCDKRWGDWKCQLKELERRSMNKNSRGNYVS